jgi:hypothetical protein
MRGTKRARSQLLLDALFEMNSVFFWKSLWEFSMVPTLHALPEQHEAEADAEAEVDAEAKVLWLQRPLVTKSLPRHLPKKRR